MLHRGMSGKKSRRWYCGGVEALLGLGACTGVFLILNVFLMHMRPRGDNCGDTSGVPLTIGVGRSEPTTKHDLHPPRDNSVKNEMSMGGPKPPEDYWDGVMKEMPSKPRSELDIHVVFSTDCSPYQNFQSTLLFHSAEVRVSQPLLGYPSPMTRIAATLMDRFSLPFVVTSQTFSKQLMPTEYPRIFHMWRGRLNQQQLIQTTIFLSSLPTGLVHSSIFNSCPYDPFRPHETSAIMKLARLLWVCKCAS